MGRHFGLQRIAPALPPAARVGRLRRSQRRERRLREILTGIGLVEVINYAFVAGAHVDAGSGVRLANPLTEDQDTLRTSLVMPGLLETVRSNQRLGRRDVAVFEIGRVFVRADGAPCEELRLGVLLAGSTHPHHWSIRSRPFDLYDLKGIVDLLFARLGEPAPELDGTSPPPAFLHPRRAVSLRREGRPVGHAGAVHPDVRAAWELKDEAVVVEVGLDALLEEAPRVARFTALDRFPAVQRDLSIVCDETTPAADRRAGARGGRGPAALGEPPRPRHRQPGAPGQGQPPGQPALPGPRAHAQYARSATDCSAASSHGASDAADPAENLQPRLHSVLLPDRARAVGVPLSALGLEPLVEVTGVRRKGARSQRPGADWVFEPGDVVVLLGKPENLLLAEKRLVHGR